MTYALRGARPRAAHALAAPIQRVIALTARGALGLSKDTFHEPFHAYGLASRSSVLYVTSLSTASRVHERAQPSVGRRLTG